MVSLNLDSKVLVLHHNDFDGVVSAIVVCNVFKNPAFCGTTEFYNIEDKLKIVDYDNYDAVFVLDCHPSNAAYLDISDKLILIDHHESPYNDPAKGRFVLSGKNKSAAWVTKYVMEKLFKNSIDLSHLNRLVDLATDYDCWIRKYPLSTFVADMYKGLYEPYQFRKRFMSGDCRLTQEEISYVRKRKSEFEDVYNNVMLTDIEGINGCIAYNDKFVNEISQRLADDGYKIVFTKINGKNRVSIRHYVAGVDIGKVLENLGIGGGHPQAAGFFEDDSDVMFQKIMDVVDVIKDYPGFEADNV